MNFTAFAQGIDSQRDEDLRSRQGLAQAFQTFKAQNPHASYDEYQSFIDNMSGGRNYLRGGAPGKEVLQGLAKTNAERKAQDELARQMDTTRQKAQLIGTLEAQADQFLLNMDSDDYAGAYDAFTKQFGPDMGPLFENMNVAGLFTPQRRQRLVTERVTTMLPQAVEYARTLDGDVQPQDLAKMFGIPLSIAKPLTDRVQRETTQLRRAEEQQNLTWMESNWSRVSREMDEVVQNGGDIGGAFDDALGRYGISIPKEERERRVKMYQNEVAERERLKTEERAGLVQRSRAELRASIKNDPDFNAAVFSDPEYAREIAEGYLRDVPEAMREQVAEGLVDEVLNARIRTLQLQQDAEREQAKAGLREGIVGQKEALREQSVQAATQYFGDSKTGTPNAGSFNSVLAAQNIARGHLMSPVALDILRDAFSAAPSDAPLSELIAIGTNALNSAGIPTMQAAQDERAQSFQRQSGIVEDDMTFDTWAGETKSDIDAMRTNVEKGLEAALAVPDPKARLTDLRVARELAGRSAQAIASTMESDRMNQQRILTVGTGRWNDQVQSDLSDQLSRTAEALVARIDAEIAKLEAETQATSQTGATNRTRPVAPPSATGEPSAFQDWTSGLLGGFNARGDYQSGMRKLESNTIFQNSSQDLAEQARVRELMSDDFVRKWITEDPARARAFNEDPIAFFNSPEVQAVLSK